MPQILVVEDQTNLLRSIVRALNEAGYQAEPAESLSQASRQMNADVDLVILDLMLPDGSGLNWLQALRETGSRTPVLILTARDSIEDRVTGLDMGADDYLVKPFALDELLARIRALLRREKNPVEQIVTWQDLTVNLLSRTVERAGRSIDLQNRQLELLAYLMSHADQVVSREMIARDVWKEPTATWTNVIEVQINQLRKKIEAPDQAPILHTIRGEGYRLGEQP
ncbi:MAG: DNA-binding response regulator [Gimesia sp.]|jgi:DNA-binding response OmpR family regulator|uniref:Response regulator MprA n=1 Tax=Gimesia chilikensis TaxID=2605989 RepID=A0A517PL19_9PLAN|nr:response regulator transcription factor [Gimesia chilikensis]MBN69917.1 DNA-binding response regulator [Gimesia sp.]MCR9232232.1 response regulator transcription factor [bacterium]QDT20068.1 Response regulator MprA [Gimesia chilikensis]